MSSMRSVSLSQSDAFDGPGAGRQEYGGPGAGRGLVLPFRPLSIAFQNINYFVDMPPVSVLSRVLSLS